MKKTSIFTILALFCLVLVSCGGSSKSESAEGSAGTISVDQLLADAENLVGDTVVIEGVCSHLCRHGGRKAFVVGSADSVLIRCEAFPLMGEPFPKSTIHQPIQVKGVVCEERVDEAAIQKMIQQYEETQKATAEKAAEAGEEAAGEVEVGCATERTAQGQKNLTAFEDRIADYRARIAARQEKEGKPYLSFYCLQAISYEILPE